MYETLKRWAFLCDPRTGKFGLREIRDLRTNQVYMRRWPLITTPWFEVKLHHILLPDGERELHDHPWSFLSFVLRGWYLEESQTYPSARKRINLIRWINRKSAIELHRIAQVPPKGVWTLVFCGRRVREWGFSFPGGRWQKWDEYILSKGGTLP